MTASKKRRTRRVKLAEARRKKAEATQPQAPDTGVRGAEPAQAVDASKTPHPHITTPQIACEPAPAPSPQEAHGAILDNNLVGRSIRLRWGITDKHKDAAIGVTVRNMAMKDGRVSNGAVRNLTAMEAQNQRDDQPDQPGVSVQVNTQVNTGINMEQVRQELLTKRPDLIDERRKAEVARAGVEHKQSVQDRVVELPAAEK